jgi:hypothetical protein
MQRSFRLRRHDREWLTYVVHAIDREYGLIGHERTEVSRAGNVSRREHRDDTRHGAG